MKDLHANGQTKLKLIRLTVLADKFNKVQNVIKSIAVIKKDEKLVVCIYTPYDCSNNTLFNFYGNIEKTVGDVCDIFLYNDLNEDMKETFDTDGTVIFETTDENKQFYSKIIYIFMR